MTEQKVVDAYLADIRGALYEEQRQHRRRVELMRTALDAGVPAAALADAIRQQSPDAEINLELELLGEIEFGEAERVQACSGNPDWLVSVASTGKQQLVAHCPYRSYAIAVGQALAWALSVELEVVE